MIAWFTILQVAVAVAAGFLCVISGLAGRKPADLTNGSVLAVEILLMAQLIVAIVAPALGNVPTGNPLEFYAYIIAALVLPPLAVFWGLIERTRWSTVVLGVACLAIAVMLYRMYQIWFVQVA